MLNRSLLKTFNLFPGTQRFNFSRYKIKNQKKKTKKYEITKETVVDDKFIKLTTKDDATSKIGQLAKLREHNLKILPEHNKSLDVGINQKIIKELERLKINTKIDVYDEPLTLYSLLKEAQLTQLDSKKDNSVDYVYDDNIENLLGKTMKEIKEQTHFFNVERQVNEKFHIEVKKLYKIKLIIIETQWGYI